MSYIVIGAAAIVALLIWLKVRRRREKSAFNAAHQTILFAADEGDKQVERCQPDNVWSEFVGHMVAQGFLVYNDRHRGKRRGVSITEQGREEVASWRQSRY